MARARSDAANFIAIDLGASSGRVMHAIHEAETIRLSELHRFPNRMVRMHDATPDGRLCWDVLALWEEIKIGLRKAAALGPDMWTSIGVASWGVDYALLGKSGRLLGFPTAYRDPRNQRAADRVQPLLGRERIYNATGIQFLPFNTLYQLAADAEDPDAPLARAQAFLMIPDLFHYWLSGRVAAEHTNASTTQAYDAVSRTWWLEICEPLRIPPGIFPNVVDSGTQLGSLLPKVAAEVGLSPKTLIVAPATHDTGSAVAGTPLARVEHEAYLSSGTWSLLGMELTSPCRSAEAFAANFTNEAGAYGTHRFLTNRCGMWLVQECQHQAEREGRTLGFEEFVRLAEASEPLRTVFNPDDPTLSSPGDMPARICRLCREAGEPEPSSAGALARAIFDSLALRYAGTLRTMERITGHEIDTIRIVGGGAHNALLNRLTASATSCAVSVGPTEATALGNAVVQAITAGAIRDLAAARCVVKRSINTQMLKPDYQSVSREQWSAAAVRLKAIGG